MKTRHLMAIVIFGGPLYVIYGGIIGWTMGSLIGPPLGLLLTVLLTIAPLWALGLVAYVRMQKDTSQ